MDKHLRIAQLDSADLSSESLASKYGIRDAIYILLTILQQDLKLPQKRKYSVEKLGRFIVKFHELALAYHKMGKKEDAKIADLAAEVLHSYTVSREFIQFL